MYIFHLILGPMPLCHINSLLCWVIVNKVNNCLTKLNESRLQHKLYVFIHKFETLVKTKPPWQVTKYDAVLDSGVLFPTVTWDLFIKETIFEDLNRCWRHFHVFGRRLFFWGCFDQFPLPPKLHPLLHKPPAYFIFIFLRITTPWDRFWLCYSNSEGG